MVASSLRSYPRPSRRLWNGDPRPFSLEGGSGRRVHQVGGDWLQLARGNRGAGSAARRKRRADLHRASHDHTNAWRDFGLWDVFGDWAYLTEHTVHHAGTVTGAAGLAGTVSQRSRSSRQRGKTAKSGSVNWSWQKRPLRMRTGYAAPRNERRSAKKCSPQCPTRRRPRRCESI